MKRLRYLARRLAFALLRWSGGSPPAKQEPNCQTSTAFDRAFPGGGCCHVTCVCGRLYFGGEYDFYENEWEELQANPKATEIEGGGPGFWDIPGGMYVYGCECNAAQRLEATLWAWRSPILEYFKLRGEEMRRQAAELIDESDVLAESCDHERLDMDGVCRACGADCRGIS